MGELNVKSIYNVFKQYKKVNLVNPYIYPNTPLTQNIVAYYKFDSNLIDSVNANNGTVVGTISYVTGKIGTAMQKTTGGGVSIPQSTNLDFSNSTNDLKFSCSFWFWKDDAQVRAVFNKRGGTALTDQYMININSSTIEVYLYSSSTSAYLCRTYNSGMINNTFHHIVVTYDGSGISSGIKIYFNGVERVTVDASVGSYTKMPIASQAALIGRLYNGTVTGGTMRLDEFGIWKNRELNHMEVSKLYNSGAGLGYPF